MYHKQKWIIERLLIVLYFLVLLFSSTECFGKSGLLMSVYGNVADVSSRIPVKNFRITIFRRENGITTDIKSASTDENGFYKIRFLEEGEYEFLIEILPFGIIHMFSYVEGVDDQEEDFFKFNLKPAQNLNLNFFIGKSLYPDIKREYRNLNTIDITFLYTEDLLNYDKYDSKEVLSSQNCRVIRGNVPLFPVEDSVDLGKARNKRPAGGRYKPNILFLRLNFGCENDRCKLTEARISISGKIEIHSEEWFKADAGQGYSSEIGKCLRDCIIQHENRHEEDAYQYVSNHFCNKINSINNIMAKCNCFISDPQYWKFKCKEKLKDLIDNLKTEFFKYMTTESEDNAYGLSDPISSSCYKKYRIE